MISPSALPPEAAASRLARLIEIGVALSAETDIDVLLEHIVRYAREITRADAGTLYILEGDRLEFRILQNDTLGVRLGGATGEAVALEPVALDEKNVSGYAALRGVTVRIDDVYTSGEFDFEGPRRYDALTGYRSRSMLVIPMKEREGAVVGVLQLMNALDPETGSVVGFPEADVRIAEAFASQAAVALCNARLLQETRDILEALIRVLGVAIDAKSPYTGNHVQRVAELNVALARALHDCREAPFAQVGFSPQELEEIRIAGWLHDVGKVTTPVHVMDKATKLEAQFDRIELIRTRFRLIRRTAELEARTGGSDPARDAELQRRLEELDEDLRFVERCNRPGEFLEDAALERLRSIARKTYRDGGRDRPYLTDDEVRHLSIRRGSLTPEEMAAMREHVAWTARMLEQIPFSKHLSNVPRFAAHHHERLNGTGYPQGLTARDLPLQSRILAVADFYEALSAKDRPYKRPMDRDTVLAILRKAAAAGEIDGDILELAVREGVFDRFEARYGGREAPDGSPAQ
ncbi:MAG: HD family phosphohydrolase [Deferrisomatales bacterium]